MTCNNCVARVQQLLSGVDGVEKVVIDPKKDTADITMHHHIQTSTLKNALKNHPKYQLTESSNSRSAFSEDAPEYKGWFETYKPVVLIFAYITGITLLIETTNHFNGMHWMNNFMGAFFLVFSFFKMLDLKGFAESYFSYDIIAKRWIGYGYVYAFIEMLLGVAFISRFNPILTNFVTFIMMSVSIIGVLQSLLNKRKIKCACLGAVFNLPMSSITIIEDLLMIIMSAITIIFLLT